MVHPSLIVIDHRAKFVVSKPITGMNVPMQRDRARARGPRTNGVVSQVRGILRANNRRQNIGNSRGGRTDPPRVDLSPWNTACITNTIVNSGSAATTLCQSSTELINKLLKQLEITATNLTIRFIQCQLWHLVPNGELNNRVRCNFYGLISASTVCSEVRILANLDDYGTPARNATVRFLWPETHQARVFSGLDGLNVFRVLLEPSQQILMHFRVLYRFSGAVPTVSHLKDGREITRRLLDIEELTEIEHLSVEELTDSKSVRLVGNIQS